MLWVCLASVHAQPERPNIVVILSDDVGFSDIGCYGGEIDTPHLDALARAGLRFTQFYNTARCCPTRASLLTGLHPHQTGVGHMMEDRRHPGYRGRLNAQCVTIAEVLRDAGYASYAAGKWHVTPGHDAAALADTSQWPLQRGFNRFYGTIHGAGSYFDPSSLVRDNQLLTVANDPAYQPPSYYYTDAIADHAVQFIRDHARNAPRGAGRVVAGNQPFFLYVAFTAAHWPLHAKPADIAKYHGRYDQGYEPVRAARRERLRRMGILDARWAPAPAAERWDDVQDKAFESRCMEVYAAQLDSMDQGIGRMVAALKDTGVLDNTLVFYLQDNGGCAEGMGRGNRPSPRPSLPTFPAMAPDAPQFGSQPRQTRDGFPVRSGIGVLPGGPDTYVAYGRGWASVSVTPFRGFKHWTHEGGISTPLIVHWPHGIDSTRRGQLERQPGQLMDIMATCLDVAHAPYPTRRNDQDIVPMEGSSLVPAFHGRRIPRKRPLAWEHEGNRALRDGKWKIVARENRPWELYDIEGDRAESHDLAGRQPNLVHRMAQQWEAWAERARVLPLGGWRGP